MIRQFRPFLDVIETLREPIAKIVAGDRLMFRSLESQVG